MPTWNDLVRCYAPGLDDDHCGYVLWEQTPFPCVEAFALLPYIEQALRGYYERGIVGGSLRWPLDGRETAEQMLAENAALRDRLSECTEEVEA